jgi:hypothetical protein
MIYHDWAARFEQMCDMEWAEERTNEHRCEFWDHATYLGPTLTKDVL